LTNPNSVTLAQAFWYWLKLGYISFCGPAGQIAIMHHLVEKKRWISEKRFLHALNYCMALPGPEAQQLATYIGWLMHRTWGGIIAGGLFVLPSFFILLALAWIYMAYGSVPAVAGALYGIKPAAAPSSRPHTAILQIGFSNWSGIISDNILFGRGRSSGSSCRLC
jgi:chromate transporter